MFAEIHHCDNELSTGVVNTLCTPVTKQQFNVSHMVPDHSRMGVSFFFSPVRMLVSAENSHTPLTDTSKV